MSPQVSTGDGDTFVVVLFKDSGGWQGELLPERLSEDLDALLDTLRQQPSDVAPIALVDVGDDFFVVARPAPAGADRLLLSDVTAAAVDDLARQVCVFLDIEPPEDDDDIAEVWPAGDLGIFTDLGMDEMEVGALLSDLDAYADEQLLALTRRLGLAGAFERVVDVAVR